MTVFSWEYPLTTTEKVRRVFQCYERELQFVEESCRALHEKGRQQELYIAALRKACSRVAISHAGYDNNCETPQHVYIGDDGARSGISEVDTPTTSTQCGSDGAPRDTATSRLSSRSNSDDGAPSSRNTCAGLERPQTVYFGTLDAGDGDDVSTDLEESHRALDCRPKSMCGARISVATSLGLAVLLFLLVLCGAFGAEGTDNHLGVTNNSASIQQAEQHRVPLLEDEHDDVSPDDLNAYGLTMAYQYHRLDEAHFALLQAVTKDKTNPIYYNNLAYILMLKSESGGEKSAEERQLASMLVRRAIDLILEAREEKKPIPPSLAAVVHWNANAVLDRESDEVPWKAPAPFLQ